jgi:hypothetical protein
MKRNFFNKNLNVYLTKRFSSKTNTDRYVKIENFYEFMDENIKIKEKKYENKRIDDEKVLLSVVKCPMTNSNLEASEEGLKVGVKFLFYKSIYSIQRRMEFIT